MKVVSTARVVRGAVSMQLSGVCLSVASGLCCRFAAVGRWAADIDRLLQQQQANASSASLSVSNKCIAVCKVATPLWELTCHMGSHSVTCHPAEVTFPPLPQPKLVLD